MEHFNITKQVEAFGLNEKFMRGRRDQRHRNVWRLHCAEEYLQLGMIGDLQASQALEEPLEVDGHGDGVDIGEPSDLFSFGICYYLLLCTSVDRS